MHYIELFIRGDLEGNIFQLGTKYTKSMNMAYIDAIGDAQHPVMGCYAIGIGRLTASICEAHHDEHGPVWSLAIARGRYTSALSALITLRFRLMQTSCIKNCKINQ